MTSRVRVSKICEYCNEIFTAKTSVTRYCSDRCNKRHYKQKKKDELLLATRMETIQNIQKPITEIQAKEYLSIMDTTIILNVSRSTIYRLIKDKKLKVAKIGSRVIIRKADIEKLFQ